MTFTPLEAALVSVVSSIVVGVVVRVMTAATFVSKAQCQANHKRECQDTENMQNKLNILFRMLRALVTFSNIPEDKKVEILNEKGSS